jgi:TolA-binding protein
LSEELIDRYLLGDLPEERQAEIEERAFLDRQYLQRILAAESDLIDEYVRGGLSDSQRRLFDSRFLASPERRRKVEFARALSTVISEGAVAEKETAAALPRAPASLWSSFAGFFRGLRPATGFSLAAASLLLMIGISWIVKERARLRTQVAQLQAEQQTQQSDRQTLERQLADERERSKDLSSRLQTEKEQRERSEESARKLERERQEIAAKPPQPVPPAQPSVVSLALLAGISRSSSGTRPKLVLPLSARLVRLQIGIEPGDDYKSFRAELNTQGGQRVLTQDNLSARAARGGRIIILSVPARILEAGQYELSLKGRDTAGTTVDIGYYYFEVLKK